jgi:aspartyl-tRNA(Asn)/glutamyl-tRNA(Gln) amidotransferase subunit A
MTGWEGETIVELAGALAERRTTSVALVERCLQRIAQLNPRLNACISIDTARALDDARVADRARATGGVRSALHGIPISLKDLIDEAGCVTTAGSRLRSSAVATTDATVTTRLRDAGAVLLGRTNLHEFAFGTTSEDSGFGPCRNPHDDTRVPGGSSGGSAIAVATGMSIASIGTDTGGSIRIPAAACGVVGLKPTWGETPADGVVHLSRQLDHVGPLARTVTDAWLIQETLCGRAPAPGATLDGRPLATARLGRLVGFFDERLDPEVAEVYERALDALRHVGAEIVPIELPHARDIGPVYLHLVLADAAAHHAATLDTHPQLYTKNVRIRLEMGRYVLAEDYVRALRGRELIAQSAEAALAGLDGFVCPTMPVPAPPLGAVTVSVGDTTEPVRTAMLRLTQPFNVTRQPAISIPCGLTSGARMPVGLQLAGRAGHTTALLRLALFVERALEEPLRGSR